MQLNLPRTHYNLATSLEMTTANYLNSLSSFLVIGPPDGWQRYCIPSKSGCSENNCLQPGKKSHLEIPACLLVWHTQKHGFLVPTGLQHLQKSLLKYKDINDVISAAATEALSRHLWYFSEEMVALVFLTLPSNME